jgi:hypothetical protein
LEARLGRKATDRDFKREFEHSIREQLTKTAADA